MLALVCLGRLASGKYGLRVHDFGSLIPQTMLNITNTNCKTARKVQLRALEGIVWMYFTAPNVNSTFFLDS